MDILGAIWLPDFLVWMAVVVIALYIYGTWPFSTLSAHGYIGPKPIPFFGNILLLFKSGHFAKWDLTGKNLYGKVFSMYEGRQPTIVIFDTDILKQVLVKEFSSFVDRRKMNFRGKVISHSLLDIEGAEWRRIRNLTTPFFTTGKLRRNIQHLEYCCQNLMRKCEEVVASKQALDVKEVTGAFTLEAICLTAFGLEVDSHNNPNHLLFQTVKKMSDVDLNYWGFWVAFAFPQVAPLLDKLGCEMWPKGSVDTLSKLAKVAIEERLKSNEERPDFIQAMIKAHEEEVELGKGSVTAEVDRTKALTEVEIVAQVAIFALAGYDTTSTAISFLMFNLANNQECQDKLVEEINEVIEEEEITYENLKQMHYLDMCLEESQRLYPPVFRTDRRCTKDTTINGYFIPKDTLMIIPIYALHHDPEIWAYPENFDPERFSADNRDNLDIYAYQAFGAGPRNCVGMRLAQIEVKMAIISILQKFEVTVSEKTKMPLKLAPTFFPRADGGLYLELKKKKVPTATLR